MGHIKGVGWGYQYPSSKLILISSSLITWILILNFDLEFWFSYAYHFKFFLSLGTSFNYILFYILGVWRFGGLVVWPIWFPLFFHFLIALMLFSIHNMAQGLEPTTSWSWVRHLTRLLAFHLSNSFLKWTLNNLSKRIILTLIFGLILIIIELNFKFWKIVLYSLAFFISKISFIWRMQLLIFFNYKFCLRSMSIAKLLNEIYIFITFVHRYKAPFFDWGVKMYILVINYFSVTRCKMYIIILW